ncbi:MAG: nitroreductase family protein [Acholeplasmataceae bacterium]|nr:hypothetical protein [Acholeplasmataceae bacterium]
MLDIIKQRKSVRTYLKKPLLEKDLKTVKKIVDTHHLTEGPFGHQIEIAFFDEPFIDLEKENEIGTYGFIQNPQAFIAGAIHNSFYGMVDYGFIFENMILDLTQAGLATVWLGGTFTRKKFDFLKHDEYIIPTITPVGYESKKQSAKESEVRDHVHADERLPFEQLFFLDSFEQPLTSSHLLTKALEAIRLAPSADNKQPWRVLVKQQAVHFYVERSEVYQKSLDFDVQAIDMGIALSHFIKGLEALNLKYKITNDYINIKLPDWEYAFSVKLTA